MANIGFISLGCAKNQVDCERMMYRVQEAGHTVKADIVGSDVVVINTCGFIDSAKAEAIDFILQTAALKAEGLVGKILVTGCLSQRYQNEIMAEMPEVDGILGTGIKGSLQENIKRAIEIINESKGLKISVDVPSGMDPLTGEVSDLAVIPDYTISFHKIIIAPIITVGTTV